MNDSSNRFTQHDEKVSHTDVHVCPLCGNRHAGLVSGAAAPAVENENQNRFQRHADRVKSRREGKTA